MPIVYILWEYYSFSKYVLNSKYHVYLYVTEKLELYPKRKVIKGFK